MTQKADQPVTKQELRIMKIVWDMGEATVQDVQSALARKQNLAYTTVMTMMKILEEKGFLTHEVEGRAYVYRPTVPREHVERTMVGDLVDRLFDGAAERLVLNLLDDDRIPPEELRRLRELIDRKERGQRDG